MQIKRYFFIIIFVGQYVIAGPCGSKIDAVDVSQNITQRNENYLGAYSFSCSSSNERITDEDVACTRSFIAFQEEVNNENQEVIYKPITIINHENEDRQALKNKDLYGVYAKVVAQLKTQFPYANQNLPHSERRCGICAFLIAYRDETNKTY